MSPLALRFILRRSEISFLPETECRIFGRSDPNPVGSRMSATGGTALIGDRCGYRRGRPVADVRGAVRFTAAPSRPVIGSLARKRPLTIETRGWDRVAAATN
jgi:hypothetical protein